MIRCIDDYKVYVHISPSNKYYVGITKQDINQRWKNGYAYRSNSHFYKAIEKYGWHNFQHEVIAEHLTQEEACNFEILLIEKLQSNNRLYGYNHSTGGEHGGYGVVRSERQKQIVSQKLKNRKKPKEVGRKISQAKMGHYVSEETKKKMSTSILQFDKELNFIREWDSITEATKSLGFKSHGCIDNVLSGLSKSTHGFIFMYKNNNRKRIGGNNS